MILVVGLAVAGLAGIAAAFYFSMRPGDSKDRTSGPGRSAGSRPPASRNRTSQAPSGRSGRSAGPAGSARSARSAGRARSGPGRAADRPGSSTVIDFTGPQPVLEDSEPLVTGRRARHGDRREDAPDEPGPARKAAARRSREDSHGEESDDAAATAKSRRRVGWRKGSDVDEELWPVEAFGGISDEQFWNDLASDRPLATTARTAQPEGAAKRRPPNAGPLPDLYAGNDRGRGDSAGARGGARGGAADGAGTHLQPRLAPDDRTAIQPTQPGTQPSPVATQPSPVATQPSPVATQPVRAAQQPAEPRGRSRAAISADEDPLTSPAYSLRRRGSVDGRSYPSSRQSRDLDRERYEAAVGQDTQTFSLADVQAAGGGYPDGVPPFRQFDRPSHGANGRGRPDGYRSDPLRSDPLRSDPLRSDPLRRDSLRSGDGYGGTVPNIPSTSATAYSYPQQPYAEPRKSVNTPSYGERYGYGNPAGSRAQGTPASRGGDPRRANAGWSPGQAGGNGGGNVSWGSRPAHPPANGYRGPYDSWGL
jgi:hypothetical protein